LCSASRTRAGNALASESFARTGSRAWRCIGKAAIHWTCRLSTHRPIHHRAMRAASTRRVLSTTAALRSRVPSPCPHGRPSSLAVQLGSHICWPPEDHGAVSSPVFGRCVRSTRKSNDEGIRQRWAICSAIDGWPTQTIIHKFSQIIRGGIILGTAGHHCVPAAMQTLRINWKARRCSSWPDRRAGQRCTPFAAMTASRS